MTKIEAEKALLSGEIIAHNNYSPSEYLILIDGYIYDEHKYNCGSIESDFWVKHQPWEHGWRIIKK